MATTCVKRAFKYRFHPTDAQAAELSRTFGCVRKVYNMALAARTGAWARQERVNYNQTSAMLTAWKKTEEMAYLSEVSSVPLQLDEQKRFVRVSKALARLNNTPVEKLLGSTVEDVLPASMARKISQVQSAVLDTGRTVVDMVMPAPDGKGSRSVSYSRLTDHAGHVLGVSCTIMDITERREALEKVERARQRLKLLDGVGVEDICDDIIAMRTPGAANDPDSADSADDTALLMAQLGGLPEDSSVCWSFPAETRAVRRARVAIRRTLRGWGLAALSDEAVLLVSELVTNSLRYAHGPIGVRMVRGSSLLVEVSDSLPDPPRERVAGADDEGGRGIQLVAQTARRWGTRHGPIGKTVWFELSLP